MHPNNWFDRQADGAAKAYEELPKWLKPDASPSQGVRLGDLKARVRALATAWENIATARAHVKGDARSAYASCARLLSAALEGANNGKA